MRSGEIRGLQWSEADFDKKTIHVAHTLCYIDAKYYLDTPKTASSDRFIPMLDNVYSLLKTQRKQQLEERSYKGEYWNPKPGFENLVFTNSSGCPINTDVFKKKLDKLIIQINKDGILFAHVLPDTKAEEMQKLNGLFSNPENLVSDLCQTDSLEESNVVFLNDKTSQTLIKQGKNKKTPRPPHHCNEQGIKKGRISIQKFLFCDTYSITFPMRFIHETKK